MKKHTRKKRITCVKKITDEETHHKPGNIQDESEKPFDFGGLPVRDLKKNLGCG